MYTRGQENLPAIARHIEWRRWALTRMSASALWPIGISTRQKSGICAKLEVAKLLNLYREAFGSARCFKGKGPLAGQTEQRPPSGGLERRVAYELHE
jgi:hypothetical protein